MPELLCSTRPDCFYSFHIPDLCAKHKDPSAGSLAQKSHASFCNGSLLFGVEEVEDCRGVEDVDFAIENAELVVWGCVKDVGGADEVVRRELIFVFEERVACRDEIGKDIAAVDARRVCAVKDQFADILAKAGSEVEEDRGCIGGVRGGRLFELREDVVVVQRMAGEVEFNEAEAA